MEILFKISNLGSWHARVFNYPKNRLNISFRLSKIILVATRVSGLFNWYISEQVVKFVWSWFLDTNPRELYLTIRWYWLWVTSWVEIFFTFSCVYFDARGYEWLWSRRSALNSQGFTCKFITFMWFKKTHGFLRNTRWVNFSFPSQFLSSQTSKF